MHRSRLCAVLIDCNASDVDQAALFWSQALGRAVDSNHAGSRGNYRMLDTPADELIVQIQRVDHESRVHIDIETDDIAAEVARLEKLGARVVERLERWVVMQAPTANASASCACSGRDFQRMPIVGNRLADAGCERRQDPGILPRPAELWRRHFSNAMSTDTVTWS